MSVDELLDNNLQRRLRDKNVIQGDEVAIKSGDLYLARNVISDERRIIESLIVEQNMQDQSISENTQRQILKG